MAASGSLAHSLCAGAPTGCPVRVRRLAHGLVCLLWPEVCGQQVASQNGSESSTSE